MKAKSSSYALSDQDIRQILKGHTRVVPYPELHKYSSLDELLGTDDSVVLLFETKPYYGHYVSVIKRTKDKIYEVFDPYGIYKPDDELKFINEKFRLQSDQDYPYLSRLLVESDPSYQIAYNDHYLQEENPDIATCGRWSIMRILFKDLNVDEFAHLMESDPVLNPDEVVTEVTNWLAGWE